MPTAGMRKITISMPQDLVEFADWAARRAETSRSQIISQALAEAKVRDERRLAEQGYRFFASEAAEFAEASAYAVAEAIIPYTIEEDDDAGDAW